MTRQINHKKRPTTTSPRRSKELQVHVVGVKITSPPLEVETVSVEQAKIVWSHTQKGPVEEHPEGTAPNQASVWGPGPKG